MCKDEASDRIKQIASNLEFRKDPKEYISMHKNLFVKDSFELEEEKTPFELIIKELERCERSMRQFLDEYTNMN